MSQIYAAHHPVVKHPNGEGMKLGGGRKYLVRLDSTSLNGSRMVIRRVTGHDSDLQFRMVSLHAKRAGDSSIDQHSFHAIIMSSKFIIPEYTYTFTRDKVLLDARRLDGWDGHFVQEDH